MARTAVGKIEEFPRKLGVFLILVFLLFSFGTIGFMLIESKSLEDSLIRTISSFAFIFKSESSLGKALEIFLSVVGLFIIWWILWNLSDMLLAGNLSEYLKTISYFRRIRKMRNHYIIAGGGRVGEDIAEHLCKNKKDCVIIEKDMEKAEKLKGKNFHVISGDVTEEGVLVKAGIKHSKTIILAMPETEKNLLVTMTAKELNPGIEIFARADKPAFVSKLKKAGAKVVVVPELTAAEKFLEELG